MKGNNELKHLTMDAKNITPSMKLAELIEMNYKLLDVLSRLGIGLGFGERTVSETCVVHGINVSSFLLICNEYTFENYVPSTDLLSTADVRDIVNYLHSSHVSYLKDEMAKLESYLVELIAPTDVSQKKVVKKFFMDYKKEVENHFDYEEHTVFPYISALLAGEKQEGYSIGTFEENHSNIDEKLSDLKNIVMKYLPTSCDSVLRNRALYLIYWLEEDLGHHTVIEDSILVPMVNMLEGHGC